MFFKVLVSGKPVPSFSWYHNDEKVLSNYAFEVEEGGSLSIPTTDLKHSGVYRLVVNNSAGSAEREVTLHVEQEGVEGVPDSEKKSLDLKPIVMEEFGEYVAHNHSNNNKGFKDQFEVSIVW